MRVDYVDGFYRYMFNFDDAIVIIYVSVLIVPQGKDEKERLLYVLKKVNIKEEVLT